MEIIILHSIQDCFQPFLQGFRSWGFPSLPGHHEYLHILQLCIGIILLTFGRRVFWLFVGTIGFIVGLTAAPYVFATENIWILGAMALIFGIIGAVLALVLQHIVIAGAGFFAAAYLSVTALEILSMDPQRYSWLVFLSGGIIGAVIMLLILDWALIILTSLTGAAFIADLVEIDPSFSVVLFSLLAVTGIVIQAISRGSSKGAGESERRSTAKTQTP